MEVTFLGLEVTIPDDPVAFIKAKAIELLNHLGYEWPTSNEDMLDQWAELWEELPARVDAQLAQFEQAITHVTNNNAGPTADAFRAYMSGGETNIETMVSIRDHAPAAAASYRGAALLVRGLRAFVIGKLLLDAVMLAAAIISGGASAGASLLMRKGIGAAISIAIDQAINQLLGGQ